MSDRDAPESLEGVKFDHVNTDLELVAEFTKRLNEIQSDHIVVLDKIGLIESDAPSEEEIKAALEGDTPVLFHYFGGDTATTAPRSMFDEAGFGGAKETAKLLPIDLKDEAFRNAYDRLVKSKRGTIVFPTSESTVAFGLFSVYAAKLGTDDRDLGLESWRVQGRKTENSPAEHIPQQRFTGS